MKRRFIAVLLSLCMMISLCPVSAFADELDDPIVPIDETHSTEASEEDPDASPEATDLRAQSGTVVDSGSCGDNATWTLDEDGVLTISGSGAMKDYEPQDGSFGVISPWRRGYTSQITSVVIEDGITHIGEYAFYYCSKIETVDIAGTVSSIGSAAFQSCTSLTDIELPNGLTRIEPNTFRVCTALNTITIPSTVTSIGNFAFQSCDSLSDVFFKGISTEWDGITIGDINEALTSATIHYAPSIVDSGICGTDATWILDSDGVLTISGSGAMSSYVETETDEGELYVDPLDTPWKAYKGIITAVVIDEGITNVGDGAFWGCANILSVSFPSTCVSIGISSFRECTGLTRVDLPTNLRTINDEGFFRCTGLTEITLPDSLRTIKSDAFYYCTGLTHVEIPSGITSLTGFEYCTGLTTVTLPEGLTYLHGFEGCSSLSSISIPSTVTNIGYRAFYNCKALESITIPASVTRIDGMAFDQCPLTCLVIQKGNDLRDIIVGAYAFSGNKLSSSYFDGSSLSYDAWVIGSGDYQNHTSGTLSTATLTIFIVDYDRLTIHVPSTRSGMCGTNAFWSLSSSGVLTIYGSGAMEDYYFEFSSENSTPWYPYQADISNIVVKDGITHIGNQAFSNDSSVEVVILPETVTSIGADAFFGCGKLKTINLPNSIVSIGASAFDSCSSLTSITLPSNLTEIKFGTFEYSGLTSITIPETTKTIGTEAFAGCNFIEVTIPEGVTLIGNDAFLGCNSLQRVYIPTSITEIESGAFYDCNNLTDVYYDGTEEDWNRISIGDRNFANATIHFVEPTTYIASGECGDNATWTLDSNGVLTISGSGAMNDFASKSTNSPWYSYRSDITSVVAGDGITHIGDNAFYGCNNLLSATLPETLTSIGAGSFEDCSQLSSITLPGSVTSIGGGAFGGCSSLASVALPEGLTAIENYVFENSGLTSITIPGSASWPGSEAFACCNGLTEVTISEGVTVIGRMAFMSCVNLERISIPSSVTEIGLEAFGACENLDVYYNGTEEQWNNISIDNGGDGNFVNATFHFVPAVTEARYAVIYDNNEMVFQTTTNAIDERVIVATYPVDYEEIAPPWSASASSITKVSFVAPVAPKTTLNWFAVFNKLEEIEGLNLLDTSSVTNMNGMFYGCSSLTTLDLNGFDTSNVTSMYGMFYGCSSLTTLDLSGFDTSNVVNMREMFNQCSSLTTLDLSSFDTSSVTDMYYMFNDCSSLTSLDLSSFDTSGVTSMSDMFDNCYSLTALDVSGFNTINVTSMNSMFASCSSLTTLDLSGFNAGNLNDISYMFYDCPQLVTIFVGDAFTAVENSTNMFTACDGLIGGNGTTFDESHVDGEYARIDKTGQPGYFTHSPKLHELVHTMEVSATCETDGNTEYWTCSICDKHFSDAEGTTEIAENSWVLSALGHDPGTPVRENEVVATFTETGSHDGVVYCDRCGAEISREVVVDPVLTSVSGVCGPNLTWTLDDQHVLWISGTGEMYDYSTTIVSGSELRSSSPFFNYAYWINTAIVEDGVTTIGNSAFGGLSGLTSVTLPNTLTSIKNNALSATGIAELDIPDSVSSIGSSAFYRCSRLQSIELAEGITRIEASLFDNCSSLNSLTLPESLTSIGYEPFNNCFNLRSLVFNGSYSDWSSITWADSSYLQEKSYVSYINFAKGDITVVPSTYNWTLAKDGSLTITEFQANNYNDYASDISSVVIKNSVSAIPAYSFNGYDGIESVTIPNTVTSIGQDAFNDCTEIKDVYYGGSCGDWQLIQLAEGNEVLLSANLHPALGHNWTISYEWSESNDQVIATAVCGNDANHTVTETVNTTSAVTLEPTATTRGETTYTATFTNELFEVQTKTVDDIDPIQSVKIGDANGDGAVTSQDRVWLSRYLAGWQGYAEQIKDLNAMDINRDGKVNAKDRVILSRYLADWGAAYDAYFK